MLWLKQLRPEVKTVYDPRVGHSFQRTYWVSLGERDEPADKTIAELLSDVREHLSADPAAVKTMLHNLSMIEHKALGKIKEPLMQQVYSKFHMAVGYLDPYRKVTLCMTGFHLIDEAKLPPDVERQVLRHFLDYFAGEMERDKIWLERGRDNGNGVVAAMLKYAALGGQLTEKDKAMFAQILSRRWTAVWKGWQATSEKNDVNQHLVNLCLTAFDHITDTDARSNAVKGIMELALQDIYEHRKSDELKFAPRLLNEFAEHLPPDQSATFHFYLSSHFLANSRVQDYINRHPDAFPFLSQSDFLARIFSNLAQTVYLRILNTSYHFDYLAMSNLYTQAKELNALEHVPKVVQSFAAINLVPDAASHPIVQEWLKTPTRPLLPKNRPVTDFAVQPDKIINLTVDAPKVGLIEDAVQDWVREHPPTYLLVSEECNTIEDLEEEYAFSAIYKAAHAEEIARRLLARKDIDDIIKESDFYAPLWDTFSDDDKFKVLTDIASGLMGVWAETAMNHHPIAYALQLAAYYEFGLPDETLDYLKKHSSTTFKVANKFFRDNQRLLRAFLRTIYEITQERLTEWGVPDEVTICRGVKIKLDEGQPFTANPLSSWTIDERVARWFAAGKTVICAKVKRAAILSFMSGLGCLEEKEVIVLGAHGVGTYETE